MGGERWPGGGQARLELPDPRDGGVELGPRALQGDLDLGELLGAQAQLELQLLDFSEQALLLAAQPGELLLQGGAPLLDLAQPLLVGRRRPGSGRRRRLLRRRGEGEQQEGGAHQRVLPS